MDRVYPKYRKRPIDTEAVQVRPSIWSWRECLDFLQIDEEYITHGAMTKIAKDGGIEVPTRVGMMKAAFGDYIVRGIIGDYFVSPAAEFEKYYEKVEEEVPNV